MKRPFPFVRRAQNRQRQRPKLSCSIPTLSTLPMKILSAVKQKSTSLVRTVLRIPPKKKRTRTSVVRTVRTSVPCAENVCVRTGAASNVLPSTEFGYPNSLVRGNPLIPPHRKRGAEKCENEMCRYFSA